MQRELDRETKIQLTEYLGTFITDHKKMRFEEVLAWRTRHITVVLEDIYQPHNASATIRSCDCFGVQDLHVIENRNRYTLSPGVSVGASKWVTLHRHNRRDRENTTSCLQQLRESGYRLIATTPHREDKLLHELPVDEPLALLFGTEETGLSDTALEMADEYLRIPMFGFTESFNISVSVALTLYELTKRLHGTEVNWRLSEEEIIDLRLAWSRKVVSRFRQLEEKFFQE